MVRTLKINALVLMTGLLAMSLFGFTDKSSDFNSRVIAVEWEKQECETRLSAITGAIKSKLGIENILAKCSPYANESEAYGIVLMSDADLPFFKIEVMPEALEAAYQVKHPVFTQDMVYKEVKGKLTPGHDAAFKQIVTVTRTRHISTRHFEGCKKYLELHKELNEGEYLHVCVEGTETVSGAMLSITQLEKTVDSENR